MRRRMVRSAELNIPQIQARRMEGKTVLIAGDGAATDFGEATARLYAAHGARVVVAHLQEEAGARLVADLGNGSEFIRCDVRSEENVAAAVARAVAVGVNNVLDVFNYIADISGPTGPINELCMEGFDDIMSVNLRGAVLGVKHAARVMMPANRGSIIFTGSVNPVQGGMGSHVYSISWSAMVGLASSTAAELHPFCIRVNMVSTAFGNAPGVAQSALFLVSEEGRDINGQNLVIDA